MYAFGRRSTEILQTLSLDFQEVLLDAIVRSPWDFSLVSGRRDEQEQNDLFRGGFSRLEYPDSVHNKCNAQGLVSAFDFIPYPSKWTNKEMIVCTSRWIQGFFASRGIKLRLGIDWDGDGKWTDESFFDGGHCERL